MPLQIRRIPFPQPYINPLITGIHKPECQHSIRRLVDIHRIGQIHTNKSHIDIFQRPHLRDPLRIPRKTDVLPPMPNTYPFPLPFVCIAVGLTGKLYIGIAVILMPHLLT